MTRERIYLFDTTLRDGQQAPRLARSRICGEDRQSNDQPGETGL